MKLNIKLYYIGIGILMVIVLALGIYLKMPKSTETEPKENHYNDLRNMVFTLNPQYFGLKITDPKQPLCTVMEWEASYETTTLVSFIDGTSSLYFSKGGGIIGDKTHQSLIGASWTFLEESKPFLKLMSKDDEQALPGNDHVCFYINTIDGIYKYSGKEADMVSGKDPFSKLYTSGQNVIAELRKISKK